MHPFFTALPQETQDKLRELVRLFLAENAAVNLSALRTEEACFTGNVVDSLAFGLFADAAGLKEGNLLLDVGTGGGFPLLPIALARPALRCAGIDAVGKKGKAVERIAAALGRGDVRVHHERSETAGNDRRHRERYDVVTARAVAPLWVLLEYCAPFCKVGGALVLWKSTHCDPEIAEAEQAAALLGVRLRTRLPYDLGGDWGQRQLLVYEKTAPTPREYPRAVGEAKRQPLGKGKSVRTEA